MPFSVVLAEFAGVLLRACLEEDLFFGVFADGPAAGTLLVNMPEFTERAELLLEEGTDRRKFLRHEVDRYTWRDLGSAYALDNIRSAFLLAHLKRSDAITAERIVLWREYYRLLTPLAEHGLLELPTSPAYAELNGTSTGSKFRTRSSGSD
ncbi:MAG: DegT/DnrJ/EryC1/StrS family aminotransferase [Candidatus Hydrogenedentes bacterium]|nr:DegT/DnrJ/EryC1/StrS family aminotransferase [Candidatus Hydrogenedentota bacterium]